jgi:UDP-glucose 4-epimerase
MLNILITGHKGMIGSRLYNYLDYLKLYNLTGIDIIDNSGDIRTISHPDKKFDIIIHCAALTSVTESIKNPDAYYDTNVLGTSNLLLNFPDSKVIFMSSSAIYGEGVNHKESDSFNPASPYAQNKIDGEFRIKTFISDYVILRLSNIYGGTKKDKGVYQIFEESDIIPIFGDGNASRDYLHVNELCKIIHRSFNKQGIFNIGSGNIKTVLDIAKEYNKPIKFLPSREGEINTISLDLTKAKREGLL